MLALGIILPLISVWLCVAFYGGFSAGAMIWATLCIAGLVGAGAVCLRLER